MKLEKGVAGLLPCPFCGVYGVYLNDAPDWDGKYRVKCNICRCAGGGCDSKEEAGKNWNMRGGKYN